MISIKQVTGEKGFNAGRVYEGVCKGFNVFQMCEGHTGVREQVRGVYMCGVLAAHTARCSSSSIWWSIL